tara:strand:- start:394 stop:624 length:231 start_codon:yes stop_codon:yes gene_type:complete
MKRLLLPLLLLLLSGCKYGSEFEANDACYKWRVKQYEKKEYSKNFSIECMIERSTRKILGLVKENDTYSVPKRFAY